MTIQNLETAPGLESNGASATEVKQPSLPTEQEIKTWLISYLAELTEMESDEIDTNLPFERYDLDSSAAVGLTVDLEEWLGQELDPTLLYDYPTINTLAKHLAEVVKS